MGLVNEMFGQQRREMERLRNENQELRSRLIEAERRVHFLDEEMVVAGRALRRMRDAEFELNERNCELSARLSRLTRDTEGVLSRISCVNGVEHWRDNGEGREMEGMCLLCEIARLRSWRSETIRVLSPILERVAARYVKPGDNGFWDRTIAGRLLSTWRKEEN